MTEHGRLSGLVVGRYRVGEPIGRGGMGEVYHADDTELRRAVALKALPSSFVADPDRLTRFVQEARSASSVSHPNLVAIYEVGAAAPEGSSEKVHFIAMELVDGQTLRELLARRTPDLRRMLDYCIQAAEALSAAHAAGVVHPDFKPENLMVAAGGYLKVLDFGLAKLRVEPALLQHAAKETTIAANTEPGLMLGTVGYMAPEQAQGRPVDHRSDIFAFGCVLYEVASVRVRSPATARRYAAPHPPRRAAAVVVARAGRASGTAAHHREVSREGSRRAVSVHQRSRDRSAQPAPAARVGGLERRRGAAGAATQTVVDPGHRRRGRDRWHRRGDDLLGRTRNSRAVRSVDDRAPDRERGRIDTAISADGKYLAYVESGGGFQSLHLRQIAGGRTIELVPPERTGYWGIAFTRDGQSIMYSWRSGAHPLGTLYRIPALGGRPDEVLNDIDSPVTFSPDGKRMAFYRVNQSDRSSSIAIAAVDGSDQRILATKRPPEFYAPGFFIAPSWSPDGTTIAAVVRDSRARHAQLTAVDVATKVERVFPERRDDP